MRMKLAALVLLAVGAFASSANAGFSWTSTVGGGPVPSSTIINFDDPLPSGVTIGGTGTIVQNSVAGVYAAPWLSGAPDTTKYLTSGTGTATLSFPQLQTYLGLLWGSVDSYNTLTLYDGATEVAELEGSLVLIPANGDQGSAGTVYVNLFSDNPFNRVEFTSTQNAFEVDNVAVVPEPTTLVAGVLLLLPIGVGMACRLRRN